VRGAVIAGIVALAGGTAAQVASFDFDPKPRWAEDPETEVVCEAVRAECPGKLKNDSIDAEWGYAEVYDADGMLVGMHSTQSTGCKPLDEHLLLSHQHFVKVFSKAGQPDLDAITAVVKPGTPKDAVRLIKRGSTQVSFGC
jgi:hypothetical protein